MAPPTSSVMVVGDVHPQVFAFETAMSTATSPTPSPTTPTTSTRPPVREALSGTHLATSTAAATLRTVAVQKSACQLRSPR